MTTNQNLHDIKFGSQQILKHFHDKFVNMIKSINNLQFI
ncbi:hypothetical protein VCRA2121O157_160024 [Vibrio crassostreae]|nr:hypothetical protein VCRA2113O138_150090 [Vibrio crassostreae]CAK1786362.1 hypothetical protein VCRA2113O140_160024 [Vibrio crassostreae]CAK2647700.1 hypothetical protein VCRA2119O148_150090 [Vibrio crassostreae]CAK2662401.1 hypothetical protein VCRA2121O154_160090 [Vibrio crassostreae]CAK2665473.1 hypothetical protein VCRA2113O139_160092 [Vibrio crassostreae]